VKNNFELAEVANGNIKAIELLKMRFLTLNLERFKESYAFACKRRAVTHKLVGEHITTAGAQKTSFHILKALQENLMMTLGGQNKLVSGR
jgi:hypothetical protein